MVGVQVIVPFPAAVRTAPEGVPRVIVMVDPLITIAMLTLARLRPRLPGRA